MASPFSWSDTVHIAFGSCLPCLKPTPTTTAEDLDESQNHNPAINRIPRARPDELQGLLADPDTDIEAERMSLHSNPGRQRNRNKKKRRGKQNDGKRHRITLFGYDLFGHAAPPPIQLPDDADDALYGDSGGRRRGVARQKSVATAHSTASTFDSDAAPLDSEAIAAMSSPSAIEAAAQAAADAEALRLKEKEERRKRRREKKELKRVAEALARQGVVGDGEGEDFEGFQGSGATNTGYPRIPNMTLEPTSDSGSGSALSGSTRDGFGRFVSAPAPPPGPYIPPTQDDEDEAADLDGGTYARRAPRGGPGADRSGGGSDSRSRTSASMSDRAHQFPDPRNVLAHLKANAHTPSRLSSPSQPPSQSQPELGEQQKKRSKKSKSASSRTTRSHSSTTASQSPSLASPSLPAFPAEVQEVVSPSTVEQGQGFFDLEDELPVRNNTSAPQVDVPKIGAEFPSTRIGGGGFPMTGFGGGGARKPRDFGAFLARRGDDDGIDGL
ncbi:hypothetical protein M413DRAFT_449055 [Hebeloma cylindrosporum]|uniref:Uncharacterized protein n=1 Tax=Hebeloma cylindrosporum TaxID=76867 RepID=A0A0C3BJ40_HEBCY|nr:hypothetical protein M413DRAFT_449055 [Hebeloma cylindrosporum h7]